ncbi:MAG: hypothetical protein GXP45_01350 [bacterium]|nr:hypothetical protein [bacterium]
MTPVQDAHGQDIQRTKCEVYTRVMGYFRPVNFFNEGKKSEFYSRKYFTTSHPNTQFNEEFGSCKSEGTKA